MATRAINLHYLVCDGTNCGATFGTPPAEPFASTIEARAAAYGSGWRFPERVRANGTESKTVNDVCPTCAPWVKWGSLDDKGRFAGNDFDRYQRPLCPRCRVPAACNWVDMTRIDDPVSMYQPNRHWCESEGCVDERGYNVVPVHGERQAAGLPPEVRE